jgi:transcriptional regulator with XRE-family HTH domain
VATSPSSSAQAARERVARRLRDLRADAGLTGTELAARCGWTHPKTSRLENGRTAPTPEDIRRWCHACDADEQAVDIIAQSRDAESAYMEWRRQMRTGLKRLQDSYVDLYRATSLFRIYSPTLMPGLLQTEGYARALLTSVASLYDAPNDVGEAVAARVERSAIVHQPGRKFVMVIEESVLRHRLGSADAMAAQLGYLLTAGALPAVSLGVVPHTVWPQELFHIYDDRLVSVELMSARVQITEPSEVALYLQAFEQLRSMAVYGQDARALILNAIQALR